MIAAASTGVIPVENLSFLATLPDEVHTLVQLSVDEKLAALEAGARFLASDRGAVVLEEMAAGLVDRGYPAGSAQIELALLPQLLSEAHLRAVVDNPAALPNGHALLDGRLVEIGPGVRVSGMPVGPVLIVGSGNSLIPAVTSVVQALLASCPVALRGSQVNHPALVLLLGELRRAGDPVLAALLDRVHPFFLDHRDPAQAGQLRRLVRTGPFAVGNFWGGRSALDRLVADLGQNPQHPVAVAMEPLTGVAVVSQDYLADPAVDITREAKALAYAMTVLGQQMCSSPTEGYFIGDVGEAEGFARAVSEQLRVDRGMAGGVGGAKALQLDRVRDRCADAGSLVLVPTDDDTSWTVVVSAGESVFTRLPPECALHIHDRRGFLELIAVPDLRRPSSGWLETSPWRSCCTGCGAAAARTGSCHRNTSWCGMRSNRWTVGIS